jgi:hypothetical protein
MYCRTIQVCACHSHDVSTNKQKNNKGRASTVKYYCCDSGSPPLPKYNTIRMRLYIPPKTILTVLRLLIPLPYPCHFECSLSFRLFIPPELKKSESLFIKDVIEVSTAFLPSFLPTQPRLLPQMRRPVPSFKVKTCVYEIHICVPQVFYPPTHHLCLRCLGYL